MRHAATAQIGSPGDTAHSLPMQGAAETVHSSDIHWMADSWQSLANEGECREPFFQPGWFQSFAGAFYPDRSFLLVSARRGSNLRGVLPLIPARNIFGVIPARALRSLSNVHSCRFDLVHGKTDREEAAEAVWQTLRDREEWDAIEVLDVPEGGAFETVMKCALGDGFHVGTWPTRKSPYLQFPEKGSDPFKNCPQQFKGSRSKLRGKQRKLEKEGQVSFRLIETADPEALRAFFALEAAGWKGKEGSAIALSPTLITFYTKVAQECAQGGRLRLYSLCLGEKTIAMHFGLFMDNCYYTPKIAYDEAYRRVSPGLLLFQHVVKTLVEEGVQKLDLLGPRMEWKCMWTLDVRQHSNCYIFRPTAKGKVLHGLTMKAAPYMRALKYRLKGDPQEVSLKMDADGA